MATLPSQVQRLQEGNIKLQAKLLAALDELAVSERKTPSRRTPMRVTFEHYCWSCGSHSNHKGENCWYKKEGHQDSATTESKMGGENGQQSRVVVHQIVGTDIIAVVVITT